jgi:DNA invertase Pin-like site-specific DNA recombinase
VHRARWEQPRLSAQRYGYVWVAPGEHDVEQAQRDALTAAGCARIWSDRPLSSDATRGHERKQLLAYLQPRDVLVVWRLDRLARTTAQRADIAATLRARTIALCSITEDLDSSRRGGEQLFDAIAAIARLDTPPAPMQPHVATARARKGGRPPSLDEHAHAAVRAMYDTGEHTIDQIAAGHGVSRPTVYRSLKRTQASQDAV